MEKKSSVAWRRTLNVVLGLLIAPMGAFATCITALASSPRTDSGIATQTGAATDPGQISALVLLLVLALTLVARCRMGRRRAAVRTSARPSRGDLGGTWLRDKSTSPLREAGDWQPRSPRGRAVAQILCSGAAAIGLVLILPSGHVDASSYSTAVTDDSPSLYYRLDESSGTTAADSSGNGITGTYASSGITYGVTGAIGGDSDTSITTAASGAAVTASDSTLPSGSSARTVELWEKSTTYNTWLFSYGTLGTDTFFGVYLSAASQLEFTAYSENPTFNTPYSMVDGNWHQVAVTYASQVVTMFVDGQQIGTASTGALATTLSSAGFQVGQGGNWSNAPFVGSIDEVSIYSGALTAGRINAHWAAGVQESCPTTPTTGYGGAVTTDSPVRYLRVGETSGAYAADFSGNCTPAAYGPGVTHGSGALVGDSDGAVGSATSPSTLASVSVNGLPSGSASRTVELWEKSTTYNTWLFSYGTQGTDTFFGVYLSGASQLEFTAYSENPIFNTPYSMVDGNWHQVAVTYASQVVTMFVDGQQIGSASTGTMATNASGTAGFQVGQGGNWTNAPFVGSIDEISIYSAALTAGRINAHWAAGVQESCPTTPSTGYGGAVTTDSPVRYLRVGETSGAYAADYSGNCTPAAYGPGATHGSGALVGDSDGAVGSATSPSTLASVSVNGLPSGSASRTVELWEKSTTYNTWLFSYGTQGTDTFFGVYLSAASQLKFTAYSENPTFNTPYSMVDGNWHQVAVTYASGVVTMFVDGQQIGTASTSTMATNASGTAGFQVGNGGNWSNAPFVGSIDEVSIYSGALTAGRINAHWAAGVQESCPTTPTTGYGGAVTTDSPVRYLRVGETSGAYAADFSGNCTPAAYGPGVTHGSGALVGDSDGAVGSATSPSTLASVSVNGLPSGSASRTVELWEKSTTYNTWLFSYGTQGTDTFFGVYLSGASQLEFTAYSENPTFNTPYSMVDGNWHQVAVTYASQVVTMFVDGEQIGSASTGTMATNASGTAGFQVGQGGNWTNAPFVGSIDEISIYSAALTAGRINAHWAAGVKESCPTTPTTGYGGAVTTDSPARFLRLTETSGRYAADYSGGCSPGAYGPGVTHVPGGVVSAAGAGVQSAATAATMVSTSVDSLPSGSTSRTVELWEKTTTYNTWLFSYGTLGTDTFFGVYMTGASQLEFTAYSENPTFITPYSIADGNWHQVVVTYASQVVKMFVDGSRWTPRRRREPWRPTRAAQPVFRWGRAATGPTVRL